MDAHEWCKKYQRSGNVKDLTQAWDLYYLVFRRISKQLPQVTKDKLLNSQSANPERKLSSSVLFIASDRRGPQS